MSYKDRDPRRGWGSALALLSVLKNKNLEGSSGFDDLVGAEALIKFTELPGNKGTAKAQSIRNELVTKLLYKKGPESEGVMPFDQESFYRGKLDRPEDFFFSRFSLREFQPKSVEVGIVRRAISLAIKAPSVCNRQPWHIYHTDERVVIDAALKLQSGNSGFGHIVPNLAIITTDLKAFMPGNEHYQHWIEGGIISMSLIHAFHSLGVASCCLNWSQSPHNDVKLRKSISIKGEHTVIMMLAFGFPDRYNTVCMSARKPVTKFETKIEIRV